MKGKRGGTLSKSHMTVQDIYLARKRIGPVVRRTPLFSCPLLMEHVGVPVYLKLDNLQQTGCFKVRGVTNKLLNLTADEKARGVVTFSTGNHGQAVAYVARQLGIKAVVCLSKRVPSYRVDAIKHFGAEVKVFGRSQDEAMEQAFRLQRERGLTWINAFDDPFVIAGHGTIGLELLEDLPEVDTVVVPLSGGGLISGIALALKSANSAIRVIGLSPECAPAMYHSLKAGAPIEIEEKDSIADALLGGIGLDNQYTFRMVQEYVDDVILLSEEEIAEGMAFALDKQHLIVEGAGAVGIAALLAQKVREVGGNVVVVVSGGNVDLPLLLKIAQNYSNEKLTLIDSGYFPE